jgi:hypothetical protein
MINNIEVERQNEDNDVYTQKYYRLHHPVKFITVPQVCELFVLILKFLILKV